MATEEEWKVNFDMVALLASLWRKVKTKDLDFAEIALKCLFLFSSTSHYKTSSSTMSVIKTK